jgi:hypothetical protein
MFKNYLLLYQMVFICVPFITIFPLIFLETSNEVKLAI